MKSILAKLPVSENGKIFLRRVVICFFVVLLAEIFLFNLKSFTMNNVEVDEDIITIQTETPENVEISEEGIYIRGDGNVIFGVESEDINAMELFFSGEDRRILCTTEITDDNFSQQYITVAKKYTSCDYGKFDTSFHFLFHKTLILKY